MVWWLTNAVDGRPHMEIQNPTLWNKTNKKKSPFIVCFKSINWPHFNFQYSHPCGACSGTGIINLVTRWSQSKVKRSIPRLSSTPSYSPVVSRYLCNFFMLMCLLSWLTDQGLNNLATCQVCVSVYMHVCWRVCLHVCVWERGKEGERDSVWISVFIRGKL